MKSLACALSGLLVVACSQTPREPEAPVAGNEAQVKVPPAPCATPPVPDKSRIEAMLRREGTITDEMSADERRQVVDAYIARKMSSFSACGKGLPGGKH
jgi:hypothetical protein